MATFTSTVTENVTINGVDQGGSTTRTVTGINNVFKRQVTCTASQTTTILTFAASVHTSVQALDVDDVKYIRVTNKDSTNAIELAVVGAATLYQVTVGAGESHILGAPDDLMLAEADTSPSFGTMADIASIQVNPGGNAVSVELFVASV
ncbi:uncharacterized protein METZ01_LOCUS84464 [marine metagenome]|jgi:hypothetical protein|uniref:Uncharacterized protein n=1 Tax=marine metagenome TaxID=408172 RepID=A0A381UU44_9ZZZZ